MDAHEPIPKGVSPIGRIVKFFSPRSQKSMISSVSPISPPTTESQTSFPPPPIPEKNLPVKPHPPSRNPNKKGERAARMAEYARTNNNSEPASEKNDNNTADPPVEDLSENTPKPDSMIKEVESAKLLRVTEEDMPWLKQDENILLDKITLTGIDGKTFYYGNCIRGRLDETAHSLNRHQITICNNLLKKYLPEFIQNNNSHPHVKRISHAVTEKPIYYFSNKGGSRVYFMRLDNINENPVIICVAMCDKSGNGELSVLGVLTTDSRKYIKQVGRL